MPPSSVGLFPRAASQVNPPTSIDGRPSEGVARARHSSLVHGSGGMDSARAPRGQRGGSRRLPGRRQRHGATVLRGPIDAVRTRVHSRFMSCPQCPLKYSEAVLCAPTPSSPSTCPPPPIAQSHPFGDITTRRGVQNCRHPTHTTSHFGAPPGGAEGLSEVCRHFAGNCGTWQKSAATACGRLGFPPLGRRVHRTSRVLRARRGFRFVTITHPRRILCAPRGNTACRPLPRSSRGPLRASGGGIRVRVGLAVLAPSQARVDLVRVEQADGAVLAGGDEGPPVFAELPHEHLLPAVLRHGAGRVVGHDAVRDVGGGGGGAPERHSVRWGRGLCLLVQRRPEVTAVHVLLHMYPPPPLYQLRQCTQLLRSLLLL